MANVINERILNLRGVLAKQGISAYVVPSADQHQSEYVAPKWSRREYMSGFTGSAGLFALNKETAGLWTDGRYFEQAETELKSTGIELFRQGLKGVPDWQEWMIETLPKGSRIGINPDLFSSQSYQKISSGFQVAGLELVPMREDLIDLIWSDRPELPRENLYHHPLIFAGESHTDKIKRLQTALTDHGARAIVVSALDEIAWLFNLRGRDVPNNPVFYAYAIVTENRAVLYTDTQKIDANLIGLLGSSVETRPYHEFFSDLPKTEGLVWLDPSSTSAAVDNELEKSSIGIHHKNSPIPAWKAVKNEAELQGMRDAHVRDGVAMVRFSRWLKAHVGKTRIDEISAADKLEGFRKEDETFRGPSFSTIAGYRGHGALPHYRSTPETNIELQAEGIFLLDSGAQYDDGTTDITRTYALGPPSAKHRFVYTTVLKSHLMLARSLFPSGTNGYQLDAIARQPIWQSGLDYNHGTGHGVGAALCVHEGPFSVSPRKNMTALEKGHILSNEPACYFAGEFGVRIENLVTVVEKKNSDGFGTFLGFEDLTLCPYEKELIDLNLLSPEEIKQIDAYHTQVRNALEPRLSGDDKEFLIERTKALA